MRWFVSREQYDAADEQRQREAFDKASLQKKYDDLLVKYIELATPKPPVVLPAKEKDPVSEAITTRSGMNGQLRAHLGKFARTARASGADDEDTVNAILHWQSSDDGSI